MKISKLGVLGLGVIAALGVATPGFSGGNKYAPVEATRDCGDGDTVDWLGAITLWPPNHKFQSSTVAANGSDADEAVSIAIVPSVLDATGGDGGAEHDPDWMYESAPATGNGTATQDLALRAERSGRGEGRTYTIDWTATFDDGAKTCTSKDDGQTPFTVSVPHDMRDKNEG
ncbi:MAG TPA: hypothetical protein VF519_11140 [Mycobacteriales bacterium]